MKRLLIALAAVTVFASVGSEAEAGRAYRGGYRTRTVINSNYGRPQGPLARMMELERAKNAWLRSTFLGY